MIAVTEPAEERLKATLSSKVDNPSGPGQFGLSIDV
jgi:hypothetical protein